MTADGGAAKIGPLEALQATFAICRLPADAATPEWANPAGRADNQPTELSSITRSTDELSVVCDQRLVPADVQCERDWRALKVPGPLDFSLVGVLARLTEPLAKADISVFAISTFDTDYLLVKSDQFEATRRLLDSL